MTLGVEREKYGESVREGIVVLLCIRLVCIRVKNVDKGTVMCFA